MAVVADDGSAASFHERSLPVGYDLMPRHEYQFTGRPLPDGWSIVSGRSAPSFGEPGGAQQVEFRDDDNAIVPIDQLIGAGIVRRTDPPN
jgi:hypothetical protein